MNCEIHCAPLPNTLFLFGRIQVFSPQRQQKPHPVFSRAFPHGSHLGNPALKTSREPIGPPVEFFKGASTAAASLHEREKIALLDDILPILIPAPMETCCSLICKRCLPYNIEFSPVNCFCEESSDLPAGAKNETDERKRPAQTNIIEHDSQHESRRLHRCPGTPRGSRAGITMNRTILPRAPATGCSYTSTATGTPGQRSPAAATSRWTPARSARP